MHLLSKFFDKFLKFAAVHRFNIFLKIPAALRCCLGNCNKVADSLLDCRRCYIMRFIIFLLDTPSSLSLIYRFTHRIRNRIGIHDNSSVCITCRPADRLYKRGLRAQKTFLICIKNSHKRNFRNIKALTQKIDTDKHIKNIQSHIPDNLRTFKRVNIRMQISDPDSRFLHIRCQVFRHSLGKSRDKNLIMCRRLLIHFGYKIVYLAFNRSHRNLRIQQTRWPDYLLNALQLMFLFIRRWRRGYKQHLVDLTLKFFKIQRSVIKCRRKPETIINKCGLSGTVTEIHSAYLRYCNMRFINHYDKIIRKIIHKCPRRCSRSQSCKMSRIILDTGAESCLKHHLYIKFRSLAYSLCLNESVLALKISHPFLGFRAYILSSLNQLIPRNNIMRCRENCGMLKLGLNLSRQRIYLRYSVHFIPKKFHSDRAVTARCRKNLEHIPPYPEGTALEIHIIPSIL